MHNDNKKALEVTSSPTPPVEAPRPFMVDQDKFKPSTLSAGDLIAIYQLQKQGFVPSDFE